MRIQAIKRVFALFFLLFFAEKLKKCTKNNERRLMKMPRAKLTFEERMWLEKVLDKKVDHMEICRYLGISTYQLQVEMKLGWIKDQKRYSAEKAQHALK